MTDDYAFPQSARPCYKVTEDGTEVLCTGMSLRDWFASQEASIPNRFGTLGLSDEEFAPMIAKWRYLMADAMLEARRK